MKAAPSTPYREQLRRQARQELAENIARAPDRDYQLPERVRKPKSKKGSK